MFCGGTRVARRNRMTYLTVRGALVEEQLIRRVCGEYLEMPGLRLTIQQAARLWNINVETSARVLGELVHSSFLSVSGNLYQRADAGRSTL
jgi:hypothetical protein